MALITCEEAHTTQERILERYLDLKTKILEFGRTGSMDMEDLEKDKEWIELSISFFKIKLQRASYELKGSKSAYVDYNFHENSMLEEYFDNRIISSRTFLPADNSLRLQNGDKKFRFVVFGDDYSNKTKEDVLTEIEKRGLRPAVFQEHVAYFMQFPEDASSHFPIYSSGDMNNFIFTIQLENKNLPTLNYGGRDFFQGERVFLCLEKE